MCSFGAPLNTARPADGISEGATGGAGTYSAAMEGFRAISPSIQAPAACT